jgi:hypothetical protein
MKSRNPGLPVFLLGHSAGGVVSCFYTLDNQTELAGLICESFAFRVHAPDFALAIIKGLGALTPRLPVLKLKNEDFSRDPKAVAALNSDPFTQNEAQPAKTVAALVRGAERLKKEWFNRISGVTPPRHEWTGLAAKEGRLTGLAVQVARWLQPRAVDVNPPEFPMNQKNFPGSPCRSSSSTAQLTRPPCRAAASSFMIRLAPKTRRSSSTKAIITTCSMMSAKKR